MEPIVLALASNERYFPGLYCAVASALSHLNATREVHLKVLDGGISQTSRDTFSKLIDRVSGVVRLEFVTVNPSVFGKATLGPGESHMTYCRILLPHLLDVSRLRRYHLLKTARRSLMRWDSLPKALTLIAG